jgi:glycosyltransferase involved in cell wall biosynthesis
LIHAHYAVPAGDAVSRVAPRTPLVVSVHGGDLYSVGSGRAGGRAVRSTLAHARLVLANSAGTARRCAEHGARQTRVVHLGAEVPPVASRHGEDRATLVTVGHLVARKRHSDVISALALLRARHPDVRYVIVGDGPERERLRALAAELGVNEMVDFRGQLSPSQAAASAREASLFVLPSVDEAFGVAYIEAMAGGVPAIGCAGEDGPEEIAAHGGGIALVPAGDVEAIANRIDALLSDRSAREALGARARRTVESAFTWAKCGADTVAAYREVANNPRTSSNLGKR